MTKTLIPTIALIALSVSPVLADTLVQDADENGSFSMEELVVAYPDLTEVLFGEIDADDNGEVTVEELTAAIDAGLISG